ncbi:MAG: 5-(carboxyamino)imidazole ribonucleotide mutase [Lagierella massiliensis]|nr:5-(carboxyamino)imidazole ribonucleotide mutase [Lagierella massiliensis]
MKVTVIMGSLSDKAIADKVVKTLREFEIEHEVKVISAHRALGTLTKYMDETKKDTGVYIGIAGMAAHLAGVMAGHTTRPVIGIPAKSSALEGLDALLSTVQMPKGVPVATVAINGGENAAVLAARILSLSDEKLSKRLEEYKVQMEEKILNSSYSYEG